MSVYADKDWLIDVAMVTPSTVTRSPAGQATVRLLVTYNATAWSLDLPADAAAKVARALTECAVKVSEYYVASYADCATNLVTVDD